MQSLQVKIDIPESHVLIEKAEYDHLRDQENLGKYYTMKELSELTGKSSQWLKDNLLNHPIRRKKVESFVHYPQSSGDHWAFKATEMRQFLEDEFLNILKR